MYEIIGYVPLYRKRYGFYRDVTKSNKLTFGNYYVKTAELRVGIKKTADTKEEAHRIAAGMLTDKKGYETVAIQNSEHPELGAIELKLD